VALRTLPWHVIRRLGIGHVKAPVPKHVENSNRGDRRAKRQGKGANDLDLQMTVPDPHCPHVGHPEHVDGECHGHVVNTHWLRPCARDGFRDPKHQVHRLARVDRMVLSVVLRLVAGRWPRLFRIRTLEQALRHCARLGIAAVLEPKGDPRLEQLWVWEYVAKVADATGCTVNVYALPENAAALVPAHAVGINVREIR
jgi:hypothetical protein